MKLGSKRVQTSPISSTPKRIRNGAAETERINIIESLPQYLLIKVLCKVDHNDLKRLLLVSKSFYEAALVARETHHSYITPVKPAASERSDAVIRCVGNRDRSFKTLSEKAVVDVATVLFQDDED